MLSRGVHQQLHDTALRWVTREEDVWRNEGNAMTAIEAQLIERLKKLPPNRVAEVVDFVEFLSQREERAAAAQRLGMGLARVDALNLPAVSENEVEAEIQALRHERSVGHGA